MQVVHRAGAIALQNVVPRVFGSGHEDDGNVPTPVVAAKAMGYLVAVHPGHLNIEQDDGERLSREQLERFVAGTCTHDGALHFLQHCRHRVQVGRTVVDCKHG